MHNQDDAVGKSHCDTSEGFWGTSLTPGSHRSHATSSSKSQNKISIGGKKTFWTQQWYCKTTLWTSKYCGSNPVMRKTEVSAGIDPNYPVLWGEFRNFSLGTLPRQQVQCVWVTLSCFAPVPIVLLALLGTGEIFAMLSLRSVPKG